jgi:carbonic anhydrase
VIHHTECGMEAFNNEIMGDLLSGSLETASVDESGWHDSNAGGGTTEGRFIEWLTISDQGESVLADVQRIRSNSMVPGNIAIYGYIYECKTGRLVEVPEATKAGKASQEA